MRKNFLLLFLMALLPLAGWADIISIQPANLQYYYGDPAIPTTTGTATANMIAPISAIPTEVDLDEIAGALDFVPNETINGQGIYSYELVLKDGYQTGDLSTHTIVVAGGSGQLKVLKRPITITATAAAKTYGSANPEFVASITAGNMVGEEQLSYTVARTSDNENAGTYTDDLVVDVTEDAVSANYEITKVPATFTINKLAIAPADLQVVLDEDTYTYDGTAKQPNVTVTNLATGKELVLGSDYTVNYYFNKDVPMAPDATRLKVKNPVSGGNYTFTDYNVYYTINKAPLTISIKQGQSKEFGAAEPASFEYTYEGLADADVDAATQIAAGKLNVSGMTRIAGENAGVYPITIDDEDGFTATNYDITVDPTPRNFAITAKPLAEVGFTFTVDAGADKTYTGDKVEPGLSEAKHGATDLVENTDYTLFYTNNVNVGTNTAEMTITGKGNFKGTLTRKFSIEKANIYVIPTAASKKYAAAEPASFEYTLQNAGGETVDNSVLHNTPVLARVAGENVGTYKIYVVSYTAGDGDNYKVDNVLDTPESADEKNKTALFTITAPEDQLVLKFKDDLADNMKTKVYGNDNPAWSINDLEVVSGLVDGENWDDVKASLGTPVFALASENVADNATNVVNVTGLVSPVYPSVEVTPMPFTITKRPITVTLGDQTIDYGATLGQANPANWSITTGSLADGDNNDDLHLVVKTVNDQTTYGVAAEAYEDAITAAITNGNYDLDVVNGDLTVTKGTAIELNRTGDMDALIKAYNGQTVNVTLNRNITRTEAWFAMVLPFEVTMTELVNNFGYCVVNVLDEDNAEPSKVKFKLAFNTIEANQPFLVKLSTPITMPVGFGPKSIVYDAAPVREDGAHNKFHGVFKETVLEKNPLLWTMVPAQDKFMKLDEKGTTLTPINCYLETTEELNAFARSIFVEEADGTVTAINAVSVDGLQQNAEGWYTIGGVKLQGAPTEKGVYIKDGKKFVIK